MIDFEQWEGFEGRIWKEEVNVRDFIQKNYTPYDGDESFLAGPTEATDKLWGALQKLQKAERAKGGVLDMETEVVSGLTAYGPGYIDESLKEFEQIVGLQTDKPLKRAFMPYGGIKMAEQACTTYGYQPSEELHKIFTDYTRTHNQAVFDAYTPEMKTARHTHIITGLPDTYGRGRIVGDYRRVALYGIDALIKFKQEDFANCGDGTMTDDVIRLREEIARQISALKGMKKMAEAYGCDISQPAKTAKEACQWLYFGYLAAIKTIHRSKGLQFPVVILAETGRRFNTVDIRQPVLLHRTGGAGLRLRPPQGEGTYKTAAYTALTECHAQEMRSEQLRLLYVALTRAQNKLILTIPLGVTKTSDPLARAAVFLAAGAGESLHTQANCFADWLRAALLVHPCGGPLRRLAGLLELPFADTASRIELTIRQEEEQAAAPQEEEQPAPQHDPALTRALQEGFVWHYRAEGLDSVPAKVSVTSLVHQTQELILERPAFLSKDGLTAAEMGTALHAFMEHADFGALAAGLDAGPEALAQAVQQENQRHVQARLTSPEIAEKLDQTSICRFVSGALFARIRAAEQVLRELAFITALPADVVMEAQHSPTPAAAQGEQVLVQGVADLVLVFPDHLELVDYKTDRKKDASRLLADYAPQLELYALALNKRFAPRQVTYKGIYSFALGQLIQS